MGNMMCTRGLTTDMGDKQDSTETQKLSTNITETRNVVKENVNLKISKAKTAQNQGSTKTQNVGTRAKETRNIVNGKNALKTDSNRKMQPRDTSGILQVEPKSELKFRGPFSEVVTVPMTLKNTSPSESVCFKVTTTAPRQYCVRPNKGIIHPQATESVQVMLQARVYDPNKKYKDKFRIESFVVTTEKANASNSDVLWQNITQYQLNKVTLRCVFEESVETSHVQNDASRVLVDEKKCTIGISSEHSNNPDCGPCKKEGKPTKAKIFCENCNAFVCESCKNCHSKFDILRLHSFISINESTRVSLFKEKPENLSKCDCCKGDNNTVEKYCEKHEEFICTECTNLKHKDCEDCNIVSKEWILNGFDVNVHLDELLLKVEYLKEEIQNIKYDCHFSIIPKKDRIKEEADKFKTEIEERTQNLVRKFSNELEDFTADNNTYYSMLENMLKITDAGVDLLKNNKYNKQRAFILTSKLSKNVKDYETILRDLKAGTFPHLVFQRNETLVCMLGDINNIGAVQLIPHS